MVKPITWAAAACLGFAALPAVVVAQGSTNSDLARIEAQTKALELIANTADRVCRTPEMRGSSSSVEMTGALKAELGKLGKKLGELGIQGAGKFSSVETEGFLQKDLMAALRESHDCKRHIFDSLVGMVPGLRK